MQIKKTVWSKARTVFYHPNLGINRLESHLECGCMYVRVISVVLLPCVRRHLQQVDSETNRKPSWTIPVCSALEKGGGGGGEENDKAMDSVSTYSWVLCHLMTLWLLLWLFHAKWHRRMTESRREESPVTIPVFAWRKWWNPTSHLTEDSLCNDENVNCALPCYKPQELRLKFDLSRN
jgi:hypothetical protein